MEEAGAASREKPGRTAVILWVVLPFSAWAAWLAGQIFRDRWLPTALCFYIPSPCLFIPLAACAAVNWRRGRPRTARWLSAIALAPLLFVFFVENRFATSPLRAAGQEDSLRLAHWNVMRGRLGWESVRKELVDTKPDLCVISETPEEMDLRAFAAELGDDFAARSSGAISIFARGGISEPQWLARGGGLRVAECAWDSPQGRIGLFLIDIASKPLRARDPLLRRLVELMDERRPDLVVGDFNSPRRSLALSPLRDGFAHAYEVVGEGWSYTWPAPLPVYALD